MSITARKRHTLSYITKALGANQLTSAVAGTWQTLVFTGAQDAVLNGIIDLPTTSRFRALERGYYVVSYQFTSFPDANDRGSEFRILVNGTTEATASRSRSNGKNVVERASTSSATIMIALNANDYIEFQAAPIEASAITVAATSGVVFRLESF